MRPANLRSATGGRTSRAMRGSAGGGNRAVDGSLSAEQTTHDQFPQQHAERSLFHWLDGKDSEPC